MAAAAAAAPAATEAAAADADDCAEELAPPCDAEAEGEGAAEEDDAPPAPPAPEPSSGDWRADALAAIDEAHAMLLACEAPHADWASAGTMAGIEARGPRARAVACRPGTRWHAPHAPHAPQPTPPVRAAPHRPQLRSLAAGHALLQPFGWLGAGYSVFRGCADFPGHAPGAIFGLLHDWETRPQWDSSLAQLTPVAQLLPKTAARSAAVVHHFTRPILGGLIGAREFVYAVSARHLDEGTPGEAHLSACRSHAGAAAGVGLPAPPRGFTRGDLFFGGVSVRHAPGSGVAGAPVCTRVTIINCVAPRGAIPRALANAGGVKGATMLSDLRKRLAEGR
jgi:hypothetical protein